ncbi:probable mRNA decay activator protein ZFP36 at N-terminal half [Coccomyxa sp. Obi]|nr:probable mRNA decay activator protein ZFP36 at N-terminal half [Coccomyxa sp. Obi]
MAKAQVCLCGLCGQEVDPEQESHIQSSCCVETCGISTWHVECIKDFLESGQGDRRGCCNTQKAKLKKMYIHNRPWHHLRGRICPVGRGHHAETIGAFPCTGKVLDAEMHEVNKKKKQPKVAEQLPQPGKKLKGKQQPQAVVKTAPKVVHKREVQHIQELHNKHDYNYPYNRPKKRHERDGDSSSMHSHTSKASEYMFADDIAWHCEEEIEAAIVKGYLREDYRTSLCQTVAENKPCHLANRCQHAHSFTDLRYDAAISLGKLPPDFKTALCDDFLITGNCQQGIACPNAHNLGELRTLAAIQQNNIPPAFKTERCAAYDTTHKCPRGEMCQFAHGSKQLRVEAAIQLKKLPKDFKCRLCPIWWAGSVCENGDHCSKAHGLEDLRLQAAINQKLVKELYKTQRCNKINCTGPMGSTTCWFFHTEQDHLKPIGYKSQFCKTWKETGTCDMGEDCHFAHSSAELLLESVRDKFVEKSIEGDDTQSQFSIDDSVDLHGIREVGVVPYAVQNGKMPVGAPQAGKQRRKNAKAAALQLCAAFERTGQCPDPHCRFAHGSEELAKRQSKTKGAGGGADADANGTKPFNPALAPAPRKPSLYVLEAMKSHKQQAVVLALKGMGFSYGAAVDAARTTGANLEAAAQLLLDGGGGFHEAGVTETSVKEEWDAVCIVADTLDLTTKEVEAEIMRCHGDHEKAMQDLQDLKLNGGKKAHPKPPLPVMKDAESAYLNQGWKNMATPTWDAPAASSSAAAATGNYRPELLPHNAPPTSIAITPHYTPKASIEDVSTDTAEWQQYKPEDFGSDSVSNPEADYEAAVAASLADVPPLGPPPTLSGWLDQQVNEQTKSAQITPPASLSSQPAPTSVNMAPHNPQQPKQMQPALGSNAHVTPFADKTASRKWFPVAADTAAFTSGGHADTATSKLSDALAHLHIAREHVSSAGSREGPLASGEITPNPSVNFDLSPQSVILPSQGPPGVNSISSLLPWLAQDSAADAKAKAPAPEPSMGSSAPAAKEGSGDDVEKLMALLMG